MTKKEDHNIPKDYEKSVKHPKDTEKIADKALVGDSAVARPEAMRQSARPYKKIALFAGVLLLIFVTGWFILSSLKVQLVLVHKVCGDDDVAMYNSSSLYKQRGGSEEFSIDVEGLKNLAADVMSRNNHQKDATCQTILLEWALFDNDYSAAEKAHTSLKELNEKHIYVDSDMNAGSPLSAYETLIQELSPSNQGDVNQEPQGGE